MCPECGEHLDHLVRFNVWLCPTCDYGETDELHRERTTDVNGAPLDEEVNGLRNLIVADDRVPR